ncbi:phage tail protein [Oculatella sp. LEGE 06141]|uniref:phage tail protein n=1 Tax=Oculatella sp. LEGE 06141 TaxID=1828648 RepID=UPI00187FE21E|nr:tail fiber protein [Oculatella sp. LEGE 06141]MBE9180904.1 phage tail protein [Oculatella sp. LEGE 06141]
MGTPYIGEVRMFAGNFAPAGWAFCDGQLLPISENDALFTLIGTTYGGDGQTTFALPDLRSRVPVHQGNSSVLGETVGVETVTLTVQQLPQHTHPLACNSNPTTGVITATDRNPANNVLAKSSTRLYVTPSGTTTTVAMAQQASDSVGGSQPHENLQPYLAINFIISLFGIYPSQT